MRKFNLLHCLGFILLVEALGNIGSFATFSEITTWYATLEKPSFNPPNWLFAPVWTLLFALMGIALYLIWREGWDKPKVKQAIGVFGAQMILNILWSFLFFGFHLPGVAFAEIVILWLMIILNIAVFYKISKTAGLLLVPYLAWVSFASILNYAIWQLN